MGKIAAPTAGSCGILPGVLLTIQEELNLPDKKIADGLFTASAVALLSPKRLQYQVTKGAVRPNVVQRGLWPELPLWSWPVGPLVRRGRPVLLF